LFGIKIDRVDVYHILQLQGTSSGNCNKPWLRSETNLEPV